MQLDFEAKIRDLAERLEGITDEMAEACIYEATARADYEEAFHRAAVSSSQSAANAREQEARAATLRQRRAHLLAEARVKALRSAQSGAEAALSAFQTLARGVVRQGG